jgi:hypothetical protein
MRNNTCNILIAGYFRDGGRCAITKGGPIPSSKEGAQRRSKVALHLLYRLGHPSFEEGIYDLLQHFSMGLSLDFQGTTADISQQNGVSARHGSFRPAE